MNLTFNYDGRPASPAALTTTLLGFVLLAGGILLSTGPAAWSQEAPRGGAQDNERFVRPCPDELVMNYQIHDASAAGAADGAIDISIEGGTPPYTYSWYGQSFLGAQEDLAGVEAGEYTLIVCDENGCDVTQRFELSDEGGLRTSAASDTQLPPLFTLSPNPSPGTLLIRYSLEQAASVAVELRDPAGRLLDVALRTQQAAGIHTYSLDAGALASGVYYCHLRIGEAVYTKSFVLTR